MYPLRSLKPAQTMLTYVVESTEGVQKLNIPANWKLSVESGYNQNSVVTIKDQRGSIRLSFVNVLSVRDTATKMQEALIDRNNNDEVTWESVDSDQSLYRYAREASVQAFNRRNRTNNTANRRANRAPSIAEPFFEDEIY